MFSKKEVTAYSAAGGSDTSATARLLGGSCSGVLELLMFHPVDTVAKRLMSNKSNVVVSGNFSATMSNTNTIIFREAAGTAPFTKFKSLYPGLGFGMGYKVLQRTYKFGGQPIVKDYVNKNFGKNLKSTFGEKPGKVIASGTAGAMMGAGEVLLLPLDVLKIKAQTNPEALKGRGVLNIFATEGRGLYRGAGWTVARNTPGSFALFGGSAVVHHGIFKLENTSHATVLQNFAASIVGSIASITVAAPLDVVKTRIQNRPFDSPERGVVIIRNLLKHEGVSALFKGLIPKLLIVGPKLIFSYTVAMSVTNHIQKSLLK